jgi:hypothetical protein
VAARVVVAATEPSDCSPGVSQREFECGFRETHKRLMGSVREATKKKGGQWWIWFRNEHVYIRKNVVYIRKNVDNAPKIYFESLLDVQNLLVA